MARAVAATTAAPRPDIAETLYRVLIFQDRRDAVQAPSDT
jgi:hypothetical protein